jgi:hypothetical protein
VVRVGSTGHVRVRCDLRSAESIVAAGRGVRYGGGGVTRTNDMRAEGTDVVRPRHSRPQRERLTEVQTQALVAAWERIIGGKKS